MLHVPSCWVILLLSHVPTNSNRCFPHSPALLQRWGGPKQDQGANWVTIAAQDIRHIQFIFPACKSMQITILFFLLSSVVQGPLLCDLPKTSGSGLRGRLFTWHLISWAGCEMPSLQDSACCMATSWAALKI